MSITEQALEPRIKDEFLALVEKVIDSPDVSAEKLEVLVNLQIKLEDRRAQKQYDAAIIAIRPNIKAVKWDKINRNTSSRYASYPQIDKMLTPLLEQHGLAITFDTEPDPRPNMMIGCCDVMHVGGHTKRHRLPIPIDGQGPKGGGVMTGPQAVKSGVSYMIRTFVGMIFAIPLLVDADDRDGNDVEPMINEKQAADLRALLEEVKITPERFCKKYKIEKVEHLPLARLTAAHQAINKARSEGVQ